MVSCASSPVRSLAFRALLYHAKNEAPEEEAVEMSQQFYPGF